MQTQSMTGFGKAELSNEELYCRIEIRSVNGRFLDIQFRTPKPLMPLETEMRKLAESYFSRGNITFFIQIEEKGEKSAAIQLNGPVYQDYLKTARIITSDLGERAKVDVSSFLQLPDLLATAERDDDLDRLRKLVFPVFEKACASLQKMRAKEGGVMIKDLRSRLEKFPGWLEEIKTSIPARQKEFMAKLKSRLEELLGSESTVDEDRLMTELGLMAEKLDITEEQVRMQSHLELFANTLENNPTPGKKLGFILQEMLREVNTMGTKSQFITIQHLCVTMKEEVEKIREQIQNIE